MASGDQAFNLIYLGVKHIDTFDINVLTYFVYHLRKAIFLAYGFKQSLEIEAIFWFNFTNPKMLLKMLTTLRPFMSNDVYIFFEEILKYNSYLSPSDEYNSFYDLCRDILVDGKNLYDRNDNSFRQFQDNLENSSLTFKACSIEKLPNTLENKYDLMHFSNIGQYYIRRFGEREYLELMLEFYSSLKSKGLMINYFFCEYDIDMVKFNIGYFRNIGFKGTIRTRTKDSNYAMYMKKR